MVLVFIAVTIFFENKSWIANVLQAIGTIAGIYLTLILFLSSKEESDKQFRTHLEYLQNLNYRQIEAIQHYEYLVNKYNQIRTFLGFGQKRLNG